MKNIWTCQIISYGRIIENPMHWKIFYMHTFQRSQSQFFFVCAFFKIWLVAMRRIFSPMSLFSSISMCKICFISFRFFFSVFYGPPGGGTPLSSPPDNTRFIFLNTRTRIESKTGAALEGPLRARLSPYFKISSRYARGF